MESTDTLTTLFRHHLWANMRLLARYAELSADQLAATGVGAFGSIHDTLQHIVRSEQSYFSRISTGQPLILADDTPPLTVAEMESSLRQTGMGFIEYAPRIGADDVVQINWNGSMRAVPKAIILTQVINHATEHRSQIMAMMTQLGIEPPDLQSWAYFEDGN